MQENNQNANAGQEQELDMNHLMQIRRDKLKELCNRNYFFNNHMMVEIIKR